MANNGTLFLDEIAELPFFMQVKLMRVLQEKEFFKVGGEKVIKCDVRIIAATNRDIQNAVNNGDFRQDLLYRLNTLILEIPPLRKRKSDIPILANYFVQPAKFRFRAGKK
jgi:transcriptional regulator with PAS, ATPase and Fis domain